MSATMRGTARATLTVAGMLLLFCGGLVAQDDLADYPIKEEQCENFGCAPQPLSTTDAPARANSAPSTGGRPRCVGLRCAGRFARSRGDRGRVVFCQGVPH